MGQRVLDDLVDDRAEAVRIAVGQVAEPGEVAFALGLEGAAVAAGQVGP